MIRLPITPSRFTKYKHLELSKDQLNNSIYMQVLAYHRPKRLNWPDYTKYTPTTQLEKILEEIYHRDYTKEQYMHDVHMEVNQCLS